MFVKRPGFEPYLGSLHSCPNSNRLFVDSSMCCPLRPYPQHSARSRVSRVLSGWGEASRVGSRVCSGILSQGGGPEQVANDDGRVMVIDLDIRNLDGAHQTGETANGLRSGHKSQNQTGLK
jgi:hypothetical protein